MIEDKETQRYTRCVKKAFAIRKQDKTMNIDEGHYFLSRVYDDLQIYDHNSLNHADYVFENHDFQIVILKMYESYNIQYHSVILICFVFV